MLKFGPVVGGAGQTPGAASGNENTHPPLGAVLGFAGIPGLYRMLQVLGINGTWPAGPSGGDTGFGESVG